MRYTLKDMAVRRKALRFIPGDMHHLHPMLDHVLHPNHLLHKVVRLPHAHVYSPHTRLDQPVRTRSVARQPCATGLHRAVHDQFFLWVLCRQVLVFGALWVVEALGLGLGQLQEATFLCVRVSWQLARVACGQDAEPVLGVGAVRIQLHKHGANTVAGLDRDGEVGLGNGEFHELDMAGCI